MGIFEKEKKEEKLDDQNFLCQILDKKHVHQA